MMQDSQHSAVNYNDSPQSHYIQEDKENVQNLYDLEREPGFPDARDEKASSITRMNY